MNPHHVSLLCCPFCYGSLSITDAVHVNGRMKSGTLNCGQGHSHPIIDFIPRFVEVENYADNFSVQWDIWPELLSSYDGYRERFSKETKWGTDLQGLTILEAGCGSGAFTPFAAATGATVISFDLSSGVYANYERVGHLDNVLIVQANIFSIPVPKGSIDRAFCFGVLQHTPDPKRAFQSIVSTLRDEGRVAVDIYTMAPPGHPYEFLLKNKYRARWMVRGLAKKKVLRIVQTYVSVFWPIVRRFAESRIERLIAINRFFLFDDYLPRLPGINPERFKSFAMLDIFDFLGPEYDIPATQKELDEWFREERLGEVEVLPGYNGLEGRGVRRGAVLSGTESGSH